jgi:transposase
MASRESIARVRQFAGFLSHPNAHICRDVLHPTLQTALRIIEAIPVEGATYEAISKQTGISPSTIKQFTDALLLGGYPITKGAELVASPLRGRPRVLLRTDIRPISDLTMRDIVGVERIGEKAAIGIQKLLERHGLTLKWERDDQQNY